MTPVYRKCPTCEITFIRGHHNQRYCNIQCRPRNQRKPKLRQYSGQRFGRLIAMQRDGQHWVCQCDCGNTKRVLTKFLTNGAIKSCGCLSRERGRMQFTTHGMNGTPAHKKWMQMRGRCSHSPTYVSQGITVCERWQSFENFYADMGDPPPGLTLERIDPKQGYSPENCKWATYSEQNLNAWRVRKANQQERGVVVNVHNWTKTLTTGGHDMYVSENGKWEIVKNYHGKWGMYERRSTNGTHQINRIQECRVEIPQYVRAKFTALQEQQQEAA